MAQKKKTTTKEVSESTEKAKKTTKKTAEKPEQPKPEKKQAAATESEKVNNAKDEEIETLKKMLADMQAQLDAAKTPQIIQMNTDGPRVTFLWQAEVADDNVVSFGDGGMYGRVVGKTGTFSAPKNELSRLLDNTNRRYLDKRWLIVLDGLNEDERENLGVNYREGELLDRRAFSRMVELEDGILDVYPLLCDAHKEIVSKRYNEAYKRHDPHVKREIVVALHKLAKEAGRDGDFKPIIEDMNKADEN